MRCKIKKCEEIATERFPKTTTRAEFLARSSLAMEVKKLRSSSWILAKRQEAVLAPYRDATPSRQMSDNGGLNQQVNHNLLAAPKPIWNVPRSWQRKTKCRLRRTQTSVRILVRCQTLLRETKENKLLRILFRIQKPQVNKIFRPWMVSRVIWISKRWNSQLLLF